MRAEYKYYHIICAIITLNLRALGQALQVRGGAHMRAVPDVLQTTRRVRLGRGTFIIDTSECRKDLL